MGIFNSIFGSKRKSTSTSTTDQTVTPEAPSWLAPQTESFANKIFQLGNADPYSFVAGADPLQTQAAQTASGLGAANPVYGLAGQLYGQVAGAGAAAYDPAMMDSVASISGSRALPFMADYQNPFQKDVIDASLADYDFGAGQARASDALAKAGDSTFGGSGGAIQTAASNADLARGRASLSSGLRTQGFNTALGAAQSDADRAQQATLANFQAALAKAAADQAAKNGAWQFNAGQQDNNLTRQLAAASGLTGLGGAMDQNTRDNAATQAGIGGALQQIAQARAAAPINSLGSITGMYGNLPVNLLTGQHVTGTENSSGTVSGGSLLGALGSIGMGLGSLGWKPFGK